MLLILTALLFLAALGFFIWNGARVLYRALHALTPRVRPLPYALTCGGIILAIMLLFFGSKAANAPVPRSLALAAHYAVGVLLYLVLTLTLALLLPHLLPKRPAPVPPLPPSSSHDCENQSCSCKQEELPSAPYPPFISIGEKLTGVQEILIGNDNTNGSYGEQECEYPGFFIQTVVEVALIEVLPDTYEQGKYRIARFEVIDEIRGTGLPNEIFLRYTLYDEHIFDGYDSFIVSIAQVGIENFMMINDTQRELAYFPHMFEPYLIRDVGYGSMLAFKDSVLDDSFFDRANAYTQYVSAWKGAVLSSPDVYDYPASYGSTVHEVKANIIRLAADENNRYVSGTPCDYISADDVFCSEETLAVRDYLTPFAANSFSQKITLLEDRVVAQYTRIINGLETDEVIILNPVSHPVGTVEASTVSYTDADLQHGGIRDIAIMLSNLDFLESLTPTHIQVNENMKEVYRRADGFYRKRGGRIYGIIRVRFCYRYTDEFLASLDIEYSGGAVYAQDDCYYVYDSLFRDTSFEREELKSLIGDDEKIYGFSYTPPFENILPSP